MPDIDLDQIIQAVFDILAADTLTSSINWEKGSYTLHSLRSFPAGDVSLDPTRIGWKTIPSGFGGPVTVRIMLRTSRHEGITEAERSLLDLTGKVYAVLLKDANRKLNVASFSTKPWIEEVANERPESNIEMTPPYAEVAISATYALRK